MVRRFLSALFFGFIGFAIFVNLYQYSGAILPFEMPFDEYESRGIFGFTSLFNFITTMSDDEMLTIGLDWIKTGTSIIKTFSIDTIVSMFTSLREAPSGLGIVVFLANIFEIIIMGLVQPFVYIVAFFVLIVGVFMFAWQFVAILCKFLLGYYNYVPINSGMLSVVNFTQSLGYLPCAL